MQLWFPGAFLEINGLENAVTLLTQYSERNGDSGEWRLQTSSETMVMDL